MMLGTFFLIGSFVDYSTNAVLILAFVAPHFNELGFSSNFDLTLMSFCTQGLPGVAESTFSKSKGKPFLCGEVPLQVLMSGVEENFLPVSYTHLRAHET